MTSPSAKGLRTIAFDAYGTLFDVFSVTSLCEELFPGSGSRLAQLWRTKQLQYSLLTSMMGRFRDFEELTSDSLVFACRSLGLDLTAPRRQALVEEYARLAAFPDVKPGLEALKGRGLRLAVLSNGTPAMLEAAVSSAGLGEWLDAILSVDDVRIFKPSPRVYELIARKMGAAAHEIGFVSANSWDVSGAGAAGLYTFWIQRSAGEPQEELGYPASQIVGALTELEPLIR